MGFPYELFVELYCYDKVKLFPFGLSNCGNRYFLFFLLLLIVIICYRPCNCWKGRRKEIVWISLFWSIMFVHFSLNTFMRHIHIITRIGCGKLR